MKTYCQPVRAGIGGEGIEVPLEPPSSNPALTAAREQQRIAAIEAAETAAALRRQTSGRKPVRRSAGSEIWTLVNDRPSRASSAPEPTAPAETAAVPSPRRDTSPQEKTLRQFTTELETATAQIKTLQSQTSEQVTALAERATALTESRAQLAEARAEVQANTAQAESDAATIRQLRHELAMAGRRITSLRAQAFEQGTCLQDLCTELDKAHAELARARAQLQTTTVRAETAESALAGIRQRIQTALIGDLPPAPPVGAHQEAQPEQDQAELVICEGGCGVPVDPDYVKRTKQRSHGGLCADLAAAVAERSAGQRAVA